MSRIHAFASAERGRRLEGREGTSRSLQTLALARSLTSAHDPRREHRREQ